MLLFSLRGGRGAGGGGGGLGVAKYFFLVNYHIIFNTYFISHVALVFNPPYGTLASPVEIRTTARCLEGPGLQYEIFSYSSFLFILSK